METLRERAIITDVASKESALSLSSYKGFRRQLELDYLYTTEANSLWPRLIVESGTEF